MKAAVVKTNPCARARMDCGLTIMLGIKSAMTVIIKTQKFWLISNLVGMIIYLLVASTTWDLDHALEGLFPEYAFLNPLLPLFIVFNSIWLILIFVRFRYPNSFQKLVLLAIVAAFWKGVSTERIK
jgi:hypothetical protein